MKHTRKVSRHNLKSKSELIESASDFHNDMRSILLKGSFSGIEAYQEVPIQFWDPECRDTLFIDWFLPLFDIAIELHGEHHYKAVRWSNTMTESEARLALLTQRTRDNNKKTILNSFGVSLIEIPYKDKAIMNESYLVGRIREFDED